MITLGITGSIGMGKSTLVSLLRDKNIPVHDADEAVHRLMSTDGAAVSPVGRLFPDTLATDPGGQTFIDRAILSRALADTHDLKNLEAILHPLVFADAEDFKSRMQEEGHMMAGFDIPLLFETDAEDRVDATICISAPLELQRERVLSRPNMTVEKFERILSHQLTDAEKRARADYVIDNNGDLDHLRQQLDKILQDITERFASNPPLHLER